MSVPTNPPNPPVAGSASEGQNFEVHFDPRKQFEDALAEECAQALRLYEVPELRQARGNVRQWLVDQLVEGRMIQSIHIQALGRVSAALGHPLKGVREKTALDLADIAVAAIGDAKKAGA